MTDRQIDDGFESLPRLVSLIWPRDLTVEDDVDLARRINRRLVEKLNSDWGRGVSSYRSAPFLTDAHAAAGWQDSRSPRDLVVLLLAVLGERAGVERFRDLDDEAAGNVLSSVTAAGDTPFGKDASTAFGLLRQLVYDVLFVDTWEDQALGWNWLDRGGSRGTMRN